MSQLSEHQIHSGGETLYILPGTMCTESMFREQISYLKNQNINVEFVQFRTEKTISEMVETTLKKMNNIPGNVLGFSMGGMVSLALAKKKPKLVLRLALLSSNCHKDLPERQASRNALIAQAKTTTVGKVINESFLPNYLFNQNQEHHELITSMAETLGIDCFEAQLVALSTREDTLAVLKNLTCPILIISGNNDQLCTAEHQLFMHNNCTNSDLVLLADCGHFPSLERSVSVSRNIENWLSR
jgi:pimeloyl-ACP methyl ester carboxylesterase